MLKAFIISTLIASTLVAGCDRREKNFAVRAPADSARADSIARARQDSINRTLPGYVIDSILPIEEELRRFRAALPGDSATTFKGASPSRDALVRRFVHALVANDTADLQSMAVHGREFADLYYPESPYTHAPYRQSPALAWSLIQNPSTSGLTRLVRRLGGKPMTYVGHKCDPKVLHEGHNTRYAGCLLTIADAGGVTVTKRYFGSIIERDGKYKFMSYTNQF
ncbi:MAG: hypothetical protein ABJE10_01380 [bacterium]